MDIFKLVGSIFIDTDGANESLSKTDKKAESLGGTLLDGAKKAGKFAAGVTAAAGAAAVGLGTKAVKAASDFNDSFAKVNTLLQNNTDLDAYKQSIVDLSNQMGVSTAEISEAVYGAISAGVDQAKAVEFVSGAMKLAEGGFTNAATAVDVVTTAINAYGLSAEDATAISDKLILTQNLGKTTVDELASSMGKIIPTANSLGVDIDSLCAGYAVLTSNGIATAESTTYMNSMLNELGKSGSKADKALHAFFEDSYEGGLGMKDLVEMGYSVTDVLGVLQKSADESGMSISDMFGSAEAGKAANVLMSNASKFEEVFDQMGSAAGTTEEAYEKMHGTLSTQIESFKTNLDNTMAKIGEQLMPLVNDVMQWVVDHMPEIQEVINNVIETIRELVKKIQENMPIIKEKMNDAFNFVKTLITTVKPLIESIMPVVKKVFDFISKLWDKNLKPTFDGIIEFLEGVFTGDWEKIFNGLATIVTNVFGAIVELVKVPLNGVIKLINGAIDGFNKIQIPDWVPLVGGKGLNIPQIPLLANGGDVVVGGKAIVGEAGAELIDLPAGARVTPLTKNGGIDGVISKMDEMIKRMDESSAQLVEAMRTCRAVIDSDDIFVSVRESAKNYKEQTNKYAFM